MATHFIESPSLVEQKLKRLKRIPYKGTELPELYLEEVSQQHWERYAFDGPKGDVSDVQYGLRTYPYPSTSALISLIISSVNNEEVIGASRLLFQEENRGVEFREELIENLESHIDAISREKFQLIDQYANLSIKGNLRDPLHKSLEEIEADFQFYLRLFDRVKVLERLIQV